ncbi:MAG: TonB family protein [Bacteroidia bacterium]|nr:TonB family protein [Bacteroidia bacterium]
MSSLLIYIIKASFYLAAFYLVYSFFLSKDTMYRRNRLYILLSLISSLLLPLITIQTNNPVNLPFFGRTLEEVLVTGSSNGTASESWIAGLNGSRIIFIIYLTGLFLFGSKLIIDIVELAFLIARRKIRGTNIIRFNGLSTAGFSALGSVFINAKLSPEDAIGIQKHEQNHLDHYHFFDIIFIEIIKVFLWFNPFIHLFDRSLRAVHEYQADEGCLQTGIPVSNYQILIMNQVFRTKAFNITNSFSNPTLIKKRMIMMTKKRSRTLANLKILIVLPLIAIVMIAFSSCKGKTKPAESTTEEIAPPPPPPVQTTEDNKVVAGQPIPPNAPPPPPPPPGPGPVVQNGDTAWVAVDQYPRFKGGETALSKFILENTKYPEVAKTNGIQGKVIIQFVVTENGDVKGATILKSISPELDAEALRVVGLIPKFEKPGINDGRPVPVWYTLPINFTLK